MAYCKVCGAGDDADRQHECLSCDYGVPPVLMPGNNDIIKLFNRVQTQWRGGKDSLIGLDYAEVRYQARLLDIEMSPGMWEKIQAIESTYINR